MAASPIRATHALDANKYTTPTKFTGHNSKDKEQKKNSQSSPQVKNDEFNEQEQREYIAACLGLPVDHPRVNAVLNAVDD
jgi:hypothetical protein